MMSREREDSDSREQRLHEILHSYLQAVDGGQAPDQEEFVRQHPELAEELRAFFADQKKLDELAQGMRLEAASSSSAPGAGGEGSPRSGSPLTLSDPAYAATLLPDNSTPASAPLGVVRYFGDYELLEEIARGGMGVVYKARQVSLNRIVALKMILAGQLASEADVQRFRAEAEAAANLDHPNIVPIYEVGEHEGQHYFSMKLVEGGSLAEWIKANITEEGAEESHLTTENAKARRGKQKMHSLRASASFAVSLLAKVARAVHHAHQRGILHRDLKPSNILIDLNGEPHVTDFGLAKRVVPSPLTTHDSPLANLTQSGAIVGTPSYMAPEQARSEKVLTTAVDVYSLGAILFELLTDKPPFRAETPLDTILQVLEREPERPRKLNPRIDQDLETICLKCLDKDPARRYESAAALATDLEHWLACEPIAARPVALPERLWRWCRRNPGLALASGTAAAALVVAAAVLIVFAVYQASNAARLAQDGEDLRQEQKRTQRAFDDASAQKVRAERRLAENYLDRGLGLCEQGDTRRGLLWLARSLEVAPGDATDLRRAIRANLAVWRRPLNSLRGVLDHGAREYEYIWKLRDEPAVRHSGAAYSAFSPDGSRILTQGAFIQLWDALVGEPIGPPLMNKGQLATQVYHVAFSPTDRTFLTMCMIDRKYCGQLWDSATAKPIGKPLRPSGSMETGTFSPDGKKILTASHQDGGGKQIDLLQLWDAATGKPVGQPVEHPGKVRQVAFSPDGRIGLVVSKRSMRSAEDVWLCDGTTLTPTGPPLGHEGKVFIAVFSPDGKRILTRSESTAWLWNATTGERVGRPLEHPAPVRDGPYQNPAAFSPDGRIVVTGGGDNTARLWDAATGKAIGAPLDHGTGHTLRAVAFSPDGKIILTGCGGFPGVLTPEGEARLWDASTLRTIGQPLGHPGTVIATTFSPDSRTILTLSSHDGMVRLWEVATRPPIQPIGEPLPHGKPVATATFSPDGKTVVTGSSDEEIGMGRMTYSLWEAATGRATGPAIDNQGRLTAISPDGRKILITDDRTVRLWDAWSGKPLGQPLLHQGRVWDALFSPDGKIVLTGSNLSKKGEFWVRDSRGEWVIGTGSLIRGETRLWDAATGNPLGDPLDLGDGKEVRAVAFSPDGGTFVTGTSQDVEERTFRNQKKFISCDGRRELQLWDVATDNAAPGRRGAPMQHQGQIGRLIFSPDGSRLLIMGDKVQFWDTATHELLKSPLQRQDSSYVTGAFFNRDGRTVLTSSSSTAQLWDVVTGKPIGVPIRFPGAPSNVFPAVAFSPDCKMMLVGSRNTARLWDLATGKPIGPSLEHSDRVAAVAFSPDGSRFLTSGGKTAQLWASPGPPLEGEVERIVLWTQVVTGMELFETGEVRLLDAKEWHERRQSLVKLGGPPLP